MSGRARRWPGCQLHQRGSLLGLIPRALDFNVCLLGCCAACLPIKQGSACVMTSPPSLPSPAFTQRHACLSFGCPHLSQIATASLCQRAKDTAVLCRLRSEPLCLVTGVTLPLQCACSHQPLLGEAPPRGVLAPTQAHTLADRAHPFLAGSPVSPRRKRDGLQSQVGPTTLCERRARIADLGLLRAAGLLLALRP